MADWPVCSRIFHFELFGRAVAGWDRRIPRPPRRWVVERTFGWLSKHRRCTRDYEALPEHHEAMIHIAMIATMSRRLARTEDR